MISKIFGLGPRFEYQIEGCFGGASEFREPSGLGNFSEAFFSGLSTKP